MPKEEPRPSGGEPFTPNIARETQFRAINWQPSDEMQKKIEKLADAGKYRRNDSRAEAIERVRRRREQRANED